MRSDTVVDVARRWRVAQRGAPAVAPTADLVVADVDVVALPESASTDARTADQRIWRRVWSLPDRLVIDFINLAVVEVRDVDGSVVFDRLLATDMEQHLLLDHVLPLALARRGHLVLHGAVLSLHGRGVVLTGSTGAGKSTTTAYCWQRGWVVGGDDGAVLQPGPPVMVEPTYATVRLTADAAGMLGISPEDASVVVGKRRLAGKGQHGFRQQPVVLETVVLLQAIDRDQPAVFTRLRGIDAHAALFSSAFHVDLARGALLQRTIDEVARTVEGCIVGRLTVPRGMAGLAAAERLLREQMGG